METRKESDLIGELEIPADAYYGVQTQRAINNFNISTAKLKDVRQFIWALGAVKMAAALAITALRADSSSRACRRGQFPSSPLPADYRLPPDRCETRM